MRKSINLHGEGTLFVEQSSKVARFLRDITEGRRNALARDAVRELEAWVRARDEERAALEAAREIQRWSASGALLDDEKLFLLSRLADVVSGVRYARDPRSKKLAVAVEQLLARLGIPPQEWEALDPGNEELRAIEKEIGSFQEAAAQDWLIAVGETEMAALRRENLKRFDAREEEGRMMVMGRQLTRSGASSRGYGR